MTNMHRRDLLAGSTLAGVSGLATGCATSLGRGAAGDLPGGLLIDPIEIDAQWARVEATRAAIMARPPLKLDGVLADGRSVGKLATGGELARNALRSILTAGAFRDLPEEARIHPTVQDAMFDAMPEFDEAIFGMKERMDRMTATERADISRELRRDPELAERVLGLLDTEAEETGVSEARRIHMRRIGLTLCNRLHQSSDLLIGEYSAKLEKLAARHGSHVEIERRVAATMGESAFAAMRERTLRTAASYEAYRVAGAQRIRGGDGMPGTAGERPLAPGEWSAKKKRLLTAGGITLGIGVVLGGISAILFATVGFAGAFVLTPAALATLAGLIVLIIGAAVD